MGESGRDLEKLGEKTIVRPAWDTQTMAINISTWHGSLTLSVQSQEPTVEAEISTPLLTHTHQKKFKNKMYLKRKCWED